MIETHFKLDYKLPSYGCARCEIELGTQQAIVTASFLSDALGQLVTATLQLRQGSYMSFASFDEEPGEFRWVFNFHKIPDDDVAGIRVRIYKFDDLWSCKPTNEGTKILDGMVQIKNFYRSMLDMIENVFAEYGEAGYREKWNGQDHGFPTTTYNELARLLNYWPGSQ
tara:strand:+ start:1299 stop:1802 length:504 start_codon:yes stop_codon:yes gene_type:complete